MADKKLNGLKVVSTRPADSAEEFRRKIEFLGAEMISMPMIELRLKEDQSELDLAFERLEEFEWVIFNSSAAVRFFFDRVEANGLKLYFFPDLKFATVGEKTKMTLEQLGYRTNFVPIQYTAEVLAENIYDVEGKKVLIPASELTASNYMEVFERRGAKPEMIHFYENHKVSYSPAEKMELLNSNVDYLSFTSGSTVEAFHENFGNPVQSFTNSKVICIGPSTAEVAIKLGWNVDRVANPHTLEGMIEGMIEMNQEIKIQ